MSKNSKARNAKQNTPKAFSLAGWVFLVMEGPKVQARGHIVHSPQHGAHHLVQFGSGGDEGGAFFRMLSNDSLQQGTLHPNHEECDKFVAGTQAAYGAANDRDTRVPAPEEQELDDGLPTPEENMDTEEDIGGGASVVQANSRFVGRRNTPEIAGVKEPA